MHPWIPPRVYVLLSVPLEIPVSQRFQLERLLTESSLQTAAKTQDPFDFRGALSKKPTTQPWASRAVLAPLIFSQLR